MCNTSSKPGRNRIPAIIKVLVLSLVLPGCSEKKEPEAATTGPSKVVLKGSNTIGEELAPKLIAEYKKDHPAVTFELESKATGYGLASLMAGQCNIAGASREPIKDERELAISRGIELKDYVIGSYSVAVILNAACPLTSLSKGQIRDVFTGAILNWKEVGGPDAPIHLYARDPISGTFLGFRELAMENKPYATIAKTFTNYEGIVAAVAADPNGIGYCSIPLAGSAGVKALPIEGVAPTVASVKEGKYPYARLLRFYTDKAKEPAEARDFIQFVMSSRGQEILTQVGDVPHR
ncbi:MAG TPA: PstS family phosphate ABC transporter substrate-binding protein [Candidatus Binatia bacterium]|nr:PstS family phosphate ABC transporter substrate-binding protein [Candidatus Binatia bacterium]